MHKRARVCASAMAVGLGLLHGCSAGSIDDGETGTLKIALSAANWNAQNAIANGIARPGTPPPGANLAACALTSQHPYPVVLVHGTFGNQNDNWQAMAPFLANAGFCVFSFTYGQTWDSGGLGAVDDIASSARQLASFVSSVLQRTGADQVVFVGHSQGGMLPRYYDKYEGGAAHTRQIVALGPSNGATSVSGIGSLAGLFPGAPLLLWLLCPACNEQISASWYAGGVDASPETYASIQYTNIATTHDEVITPYTQSFLPAATNVVNLRVQDLCPDDPVGHIGLAYDPDVAQLVVNALAPAQAHEVACSTGWSL